MCYLVMELLEGGTLGDFLNDRLNVEDSLNIFRQLIQGYLRIKKHAIIHRDLKPDNIIFKRKVNPQRGLSEEVVIIDFGYCTM